MWCNALLSINEDLKGQMETKSAEMCKITEETSPVRPAQLWVTAVQCQWQCDSRQPSSIGNIFSFKFKFLVTAAMSAATTVNNKYCRDNNIFLHNKKVTSLLCLNIDI